jgi:hypothetical protein
MNPLNVFLDKFLKKKKNKEIVNSISLDPRKERLPITVWLLFTSHVPPRIQDPRDENASATVTLLFANRTSPRASCVCLRASALYRFIQGHRRSLEKRKRKSRSASPSPLLHQPGLAASAFSSIVLFLFPGRRASGCRAQPPRRRRLRVSDPRPTPASARHHAVLRAVPWSRQYATVLFVAGTRHALPLLGCFASHDSVLGSLAPPRRCRPTLRDPSHSHAPSLGRPSLTGFHAVASHHCIHARLHGGPLPCSSASVADLEAVLEISYHRPLHRGIGPAYATCKP